MSFVGYCMTQREHANVQQQVARWEQSAADEIFAVTDRLDFLEVCTPEDSRLAAELGKLGVSVGRCGLFSGYDLFSSKGGHRLCQLIQEHKPRDIYLSPVCKDWSPAQFYNSGRPERVMRLEASRRKSRRMLNNCKRAIELVKSYGGHVHLEQPTGATSWEERSLQSACRDLFFARLHGCAFGLRHPVTGLAVRKAWTIATSDEALARALGQRRCQNNHRHHVLTGADCKWSDRYPIAMCKFIANRLVNR